MTPACDPARPEIEAAGYWLAEQVSGVHPVIPTLQTRFGLTVAECCHAVRLAADYRYWTGGEHGADKRKPAALRTRTGSLEIGMASGNSTSHITETLIHHQASHLADRYQLRPAIARLIAELAFPSGRAGE